MRRALLVPLALAGCGEPQAPAAPEPMFRSTTITLPADDTAMPPPLEGTALDLVQAKCTACHSIDMIAHQPAMPAEKWAATVKKMREAYKAPIAPGEDAAIAEALAAMPVRN